MVSVLIQDNQEFMLAYKSLINVCVFFFIYNYSLAKNNSKNSSNKS